MSVDSVDVSGPLDFAAWEAATAPMRPLYDNTEIVIKDMVVYRVCEYDILERCGDTIFRMRRKRVFAGTKEHWGEPVEAVP